METMLPEKVQGIRVNKEVSEFSIFDDKLKKTIKIHNEKHIIPCLITTEYGIQLVNRVKCIFSSGTVLDWHWQEYIKGSIKKIEPICILRGECVPNSSDMD